MKSIRITAVVDERHTLPVPALAEMREGEAVEMEVTFLRTRKKPLTQEEWIQRIRLARGVFKDDPMEIPDDPPPEPIDFD